MSEEANNEHGDQKAVLLPRGDSTLRVLRFYDAVVKQLKDLMGDESGLDGLSRFSMTLDLSERRQEELKALRNSLQLAYNDYRMALDLMDGKKHKGLTLRQREELIISAMTAPFSDSMREAKRRAWKRFREISIMMRGFGISNVDAICVIAWHGIAQGLRDSFLTSYRVLQLCMRDICDLYGHKRFPITYEEYKSTFMQLHWETKSGDQTAPILEKTMTQIMVYACYNDILEDQDLGGFTLRTMFEYCAKALCFGYLLEHEKPEFTSLWTTAHDEFYRMVSICREPLFHTFYEEVVVYRPTKITWAKMVGEYQCALQVIDQSTWTTGDLSGTIKATPFNFEFMPKPRYPSITSVLGSPGGGKSTLLGALSTLLITKGKGFDFIALSDNSNWPTYAFMPQMPVPGNSALRFNKNLGITPCGLPVLILNIVRDIAELERRGEVLTKYDRIVRTKNTRSFRVEMSSILDELGRIAEEFGYSGNTGIIAVRNLMRRGSDDKMGKRYDVEIQNAVSMLDSFNDWRRNHTKQPCGLTIDEVREAQLGQARSREGSQLGDLIESAVISARRHNFAMKFAGHVTRDLSDRTRGFTINTFWKNLPVERSEARSPLDILLDSLPLEDQEQAEAVRRLYHSNTLGKTRLMFWHSRLTKKIEVVQPMPAPFQSQIVGKDALEIYKFYLKSNPAVDPDKFFRRSADLKYDFIAQSASTEDEESEDEEEGEGEGEW